MNDLTCALGLVSGFFQGPYQVWFFNLFAFDAGQQAIAIVGDGSERLVQFVGHAGCHFAHGNQAAGVLGALCLLR